MSLILINNQIQAITQAFKARTDGREAIYQTINSELLDSSLKIVKSNVKYLLTSPKYRTYEINEIDEETQKLVDESRALPSYNRANAFVWLKRHLRLARKYKAMHRAYINDFKQWGRELEEIITQLKALNHSKAQQRLIDDASSVRSMIFAEILAGGELKHMEPCENIMWVDVLIGDDFRMSKHDALQLLTLEHDNLYTLKQVAVIPDVLDREGFEKLIFLTNAEKSSESLFFDVYMERMLKAIKSDRELGETMRNAFNDIIGPVPTYNVISDEVGNVVSFERNKPNLKVIK